MADYDPAAPPAFDPNDADEAAEYEFDQQNENEADEDDDDYDPSSFAFDDGASGEPTADATPGDDPTPPVNISSEPPSKPKTVGGFMVDDDEDEEEQDQEDYAAPPAETNGNTESNTQSTTAAIASEAPAAAQDVPIASEPQDTTAAVPSDTQTAQNARLNGSTPVIPVSESATTTSSIPAPAPSTVPAIETPPAAPTEDQGKQTTTLLPPAAAESAVQSATATPQPPSASTAVTQPPQTNGSIPPTPITQRLPHDKVGQLEDRILEDPKGDVEAWRSLIAHYREKNQLDNARKVYSRFFTVFPSAVRIAPLGSLSVSKSCVSAIDASCFQASELISIVVGNNVG